MLKPEESTNRSAGVILTPRFLPGFRLSVDYTKIEKTDQITDLSFTQTLIDNEAVLPDRFTRGPNLPGDQPGWAGPITAINGTRLNISRAEIEAYDVQLDYHRESNGVGTIDLFAVAT